MTCEEEMDEAGEAMADLMLSYTIEATIESNKVLSAAMQEAAVVDLDVIDLIKKLNRKLANYRNNHF